MKEKTIEFELYFHDLNKGARRKLLNFFNIKNPIEANWDVMPITTIVRSDEDVDDEYEEEENER